ncbi:hypothetical protein CS022_13915 [Veronia nyctiphanis]|uniref:Uncharacterized protein n=1 Tax=Veronia nyctiphanis TaxID=1278244 RepID=A0A4Q0YP06_9GAMM|nr:hypothetical protein CS022_13915 [Veronia nyctiphanis]
MTNRRWLFAAILLVGGPALLPFSLEVISLIELLGLLGLSTIYTSYIQYLANHPNTQRALRLATCWDVQPQMRFSLDSVKAYPPLVFHMFPIQSVLIWVINILFLGTFIGWCII